MSITTWDSLSVLQIKVNKSTFTRSHLPILNCPALPYTYTHLLHTFYSAQVSTWLMDLWEYLHGTNHPTSTRWRHVASDTHTGLLLWRVLQDRSQLCLNTDSTIFQWVKGLTQHHCHKPIRDPALVWWLCIGRMGAYIYTQFTLSASL